MSKVMSIFVDVRSKVISKLIEEGMMHPIEEKGCAAS